MQIDKEKDVNEKNVPSSSFSHGRSECIGAIFLFYTSTEAVA